MLKHSIVINPAIRGYYVQVGCKSLVYLDTKEDVKQMAEDIVSYLTNPGPTEVLFRKQYPEFFPPQEQVETTTVQPEQANQFNQGFRIR